MTAVSVPAPPVTTPTTPVTPTSTEAEPPLVIETVTVTPEAEPADPTAVEPTPTPEVPIETEPDTPEQDVDWQSMTPTSYGLFTIGMTSSQAAEADPSLVFDDSSQCETASGDHAAILVFSVEDALVFISPPLRTTVTTPEGLSVGDTAAKALTLYGNRLEWYGGGGPTARVLINEDQQTGFLLGFAPDERDYYIGEPFDERLLIDTITLDGGQRCFG